MDVKVVSTPDKGVIAAGALRRMIGRDNIQKMFSLPRNAQPANSTTPDVPYANILPSDSGWGPGTIQGNGDGRQLGWYSTRELRPYGDAGCLRRRKRGSPY